MASPASPSCSVCVPFEQPPSCSFALLGSLFLPVSAGFGFRARPVGDLVDHLVGSGERHEQHLTDGAMHARHSSDQIAQHRDVLCGLLDASWVDPMVQRRFHRMHLCAMSLMSHLMSDLKDSLLIRGRLLNPAVVARLPVFRELGGLPCQHHHMLPCVSRETGPALCEMQQAACFENYFWICPRA